MSSWLNTEWLIVIIYNRECHTIDNNCIMMFTCPFVSPLIDLVNGIYCSKMGFCISKLPSAPHINIHWPNWGYELSILTYTIRNIYDWFDWYDWFAACIIPATPPESVRINHGYHRNSIKCRTSPSHVAPSQFPSHTHEKSVSPVRLQVPPLAHGAASQGSSTAWR